ncbi:hypothetical protein AMECASPLE_033315 [Ameca splendens]|uniref:Uncharacterized protein n=1 Tax=Ameca splendens TaxID=208324 RepID=A0ABV0Z4R9_9TELE
MFLTVQLWSNTDLWTQLCPFSVGTYSTRVGSGRHLDVGGIVIARPPYSVETKHNNGGPAALWLLSHQKRQDKASGSVTERERSHGAVPARARVRATLPTASLL